MHAYIHTCIHANTYTYTDTYTYTYTSMHACMHAYGRLYVSKTWDMFSWPPLTMFKVFYPLILAFIYPKAFVKKHNNKTGVLIRTSGLIIAGYCWQKVTANRYLIDVLGSVCWLHK